MNGVFDDIINIEGGKNIRVVLVYYKGNLIVEKYGEGFYGDFLF